MHTQNRPISKKFLLPLHLFEMGKESWGVFLQIFLKISFENKKSPPDSSNREERMVWNYQIVNFTVLTSQN